ncbi:kelch domain-containing protein 4 isoform, partial [mine drainage metagenome]
MNGSSAVETWNQLAPTTSPSVRYQSAMAYYPITKELIMFGGYNGINYLNDTWSWNGNIWNQLLAQTIHPSNRQGAALSLSSTGNYIIFGGYDGSTYYNDTWIYNNNTWELIIPNGITGSPPVSQYPRMVYDSKVTNNILLLISNSITLT